MTSLRQPRLAAVIGVVVAAIVVAFLLLRGDDSSGDGDAGGPTPQVTDGPEAAGLDRLRGLPGSVGHPVYWAGQQADRFELTVEPDGNIYIRYLPEGVPVGSRQVSSLTVGTYPYPDAFRTLRRVARQPGAIRDRTPDGGFVVATRAKPTSVYIAYPGMDFGDRGL